MPIEMKTELEDISSVKKRLKVEIPAERAEEEFKRISADYKKHAKLPGFRPGKAPMSLIKRRFAGDIKEEVIRKLVPDSYEQALKECEIAPLSQPGLENMTVEEGKPLTFEAVFEVQPEITLPEYKGLKLEVEQNPLTDEEVDQRLEELRQQNAQLVAVEDRPAQESDYVAVDLRGEYLTEDGEKAPDEPFTEEGVVVQLGDPNTNKAFNENLPGISIGEERTFETEYDTDYPEAKLAGRKIRFTVEATDIRRKELPELNDELAKDLGEYDSLEDLKAKLKEEMAAARERSNADAVRKAATAKLVEESDFEVPEVLVEERVKERLDGLARRFKAQGIDPSHANIDWGKVREEMLQDATNEVKARLLFDEIARVENLEIGDEEIKNEIQAIADSLQQPVEKVGQFFSKPEQRLGLRDDLLRRKALQIVVTSATVNG